VWTFLLFFLLFVQTVAEGTESDKKTLAKSPDYNSAELLQSIKNTVTVETPAWMN
jgi:hypothetical protein